MRITKKETKLMAFITTFVMVLSCLVVAPTESKAAGDTPKVSILGASLRLDATEGCQSMRIGLKVENASKAKACGINLDINGKKISIATDGDGTDVLKGDKIYEYNEEKDTILYTAVITDIPKASFATSISAQGSATPIKDGAKVTTSTTKKSVSSIIKSLQAMMPDLKLLDDGSLATVTEIASLDTSSADSIKDRETQNQFWNWTASATNEKGNASSEYDEEEEALKFTTDTDSGKGLSYQTNRDLGNVVYELEVKADEGTQLMLLGFWDGGSDKKYTATGEWQTIRESTNMNAYEARSLSTVTKGATYYVKSCKIVQYTPLTPDDVAMSLSKIELDLSGSKNNGGTLAVDDDGILQGSEINYFAIPLPSDQTFSKDTKLKVTVYGTATGALPIRCWLTDAVSDGNDAKAEANPVNFDMNKSFEVTADLKEATYLLFKGQWSSNPYSIETLSIDKVEIIPVTE